jgi:hypothetical protein
MANFHLSEQGLGLGKVLPSIESITKILKIYLEK